MNHNSEQTVSNPPAQQRLLSLDAYRGLIMITLAFGGFGLAKTAALQLEQDPQATYWKNVEAQFSHAEWVGCSYWDMIQPSFMFMVGVSMAYSYTKRWREGQAYGRMLGHAIFRSLVLTFLGIFLISNGSSSTSWSLMNVLTQIGLGYTFLFLLWGRSTLTQAIAAVVLLLGTWLLYVSYSGAGIPLETGNAQRGVTAQWAQTHLTNVPAAWHKNANVGHAIDVWLLNFLPQKEPFTFSSGGYQTINFIPSLATMIFGLMCGELLRSDRRSTTKLLILLLAGLCGVLLGYGLHTLGVSPLVKRIWTPSWAIFSTGWCCIILASMFFAFDYCRLRWLAWPLVVVGMNSIAIYCMSMLLKPWVAQSLKTHFGQQVFLPFGAGFEPLMQATLTGVVFWLVCVWLYRQKLFIRI